MIDTCRDCNRDIDTRKDEWAKITNQWMEKDHGSYGDLRTYERYVCTECWENNWLRPKRDYERRLELDQEIAIKNFQEHVAKVCKVNKVELRRSPNDYVLVNDIKCNGYFTDYPKAELAYASGQSQAKWLRVLAHEYGHLTQWTDQCQAWVDSYIGNIPKEGLVDLWLNRDIEIPSHRLDDFIKSVLYCELDCERRTVDIIKEHSLPLDIPTYIQQGNAYVMFYHLVGKYRRWYEIGREPYNVEAVWKTMPDNFEDIDYDYITVEHEKIFMTHLLGV